MNLQSLQLIISVNKGSHLVNTLSSQAVNPTNAVIYLIYLCILTLDNLLTACICGTPHGWFVSNNFGLQPTSKCGCKIFESVILPYLCGRVYIFFLLISALYLTYNIKFSWHRMIFSAELMHDTKWSEHFLIFFNICWETRCFQEILVSMTVMYFYVSCSLKFKVLRWGRVT